MRLHSARSLLPNCSTLAVRIPVSLPMHLTAAPRVVEWAKVHHGVWLPLAQAAPPHLLVPPHVTRTLFRVLSVLVFSSLQQTDSRGSGPYHSLLRVRKSLRAHSCPIRSLGQNDHGNCFTLQSFVALGRRSPSVSLTCLHASRVSELSGQFGRVVCHFASMSTLCEDNRQLWGSNPRPCGLAL